MIALCFLLLLVFRTAHSLDGNRPAIVSCGAISVFGHQWFPWLFGGFPQNTLLEPMVSAITGAMLRSFYQHVLMAGAIAWFFLAVLVDKQHCCQSLILDARTPGILMPCQATALFEFIGVTARSFS